MPVLALLSVNYSTCQLFSERYYLSDTLYMLSLLIALLVKLPAFIVSAFYLRYLPLAYRLVLLQVLLAILTEAAGSYIALHLHQHNIWLFNIYWLIDFWLLGTAGYLLIKNKVQKRVIPYVIVTATIIWGFLVKQQGIHIHPTWALSFMGVTLVYIYFGVLAGTVFRGGVLTGQPGFWLSLSVISFFSCTIPFYSLFNHLYATDPVALEKLFNIVMVLNFIRYPLVALSFYLYGRQQLKTTQQGSHVFK